MLTDSIAVDSDECKLNFAYGYMWLDVVECQKLFDTYMHYIPLLTVHQLLSLLSNFYTTYDTQIHDNRKQNARDQRIRKVHSLASVHV